MQHSFTDCEPNKKSYDHGTKKKKGSTTLFEQAL